MRKRREAKGKRERERCPNWTVDFREKQEEIRMPFSMNAAKKYRKTVEWETPEIFSIKLKISREHFLQGWAWQRIEILRIDYNDPDNHDGVVTHLEQNILESEFKWALGSITMNKARWGDRIPAEMLQILKYTMAVLHSICQRVWKTQQWPQAWKKVSFNPKTKERKCQRMFKLLDNCAYFTCQ